MNPLAIIFAAILIIAISACIPFCVIMSLNTLFALGIPFSFETWLAAFMLTALFAPARVVASKRD